ncbi:MAG: hypothetical protein JWM27_97 [Gemmatimonadetes bacterium]|nr:hypothetical protein [Gemmatimonadota bacterium]
MSIIRVDADIAQVMRAFEGFEDQIPFAVSKAINRVAVDAQKAQVAHQRAIFTVRRTAWVDKAVKVKPFATKTRLQATISIDPPGGKKRADILSKFEAAGVKRSTKAGGRLAVSESRISRSDNGGGRQKRPRDFKLVEVVPGTIYRGPGRVFMIRQPDGTGGIFKRVGKKATKKRAGAGRRLVSDIGSRMVRDANVVTLYRFTPSAKIDNRLHFEATVGGSIRATFLRHFEAELTEAIRTAKVGR